MQHPCGYDRYWARAKKLGLAPMSHKVWHEWWDDHLASEVFNVVRAKLAFHDQRNSAETRAIDWCFDFEAWVSWWEAQLGPEWQKLRGSRRGQHVMARDGDKGPYEPSNIRAILGHENDAEANANGLKPKGEKHGFSKLTNKVVMEIYNNRSDSYSTMAKKYQVHQRHIAAIRRGEVWGHLTGHPKPVKRITK